MSDESARVTLGRSGLRTSPLGLGSSFGLEAADIEHAFERGINLFYWGSIRRPGFGRGVAKLIGQRRDELVVAVQSYTRVAGLMRPSVERALRALKAEYADLLVLGWWNALPPERILDAARALQQAGRVRHLMISCHHRPSFEAYAACADLDVLMVRYNAAHPGAEQEVFPKLGEQPPGVVAYTATRWGDLLNPALQPQQEPPPRASDCYRFALTHPAVDVCLAGPKNRVELDEALCALSRGPMDEEELAWMKRVGTEVKQRVRPNSAAVGAVDWLMGAHTR